MTSVTLKRERKHRGQALHAADALEIGMEPADAAAVISAEDPFAGCVVPTNLAEPDLEFPSPPPLDDEVGEARDEAAESTAPDVLTKLAAKIARHRSS